MIRKLTLFAAAMALMFLAAGPAAAPAAAAGNSASVVVEPIDSHDVHHEPDGSVVETRVLGTRRTVTHLNGLMVMTEDYTFDQTATLADGGLLYDSSASIELRVVARGERTLVFDSTSHTDMLLGDGRECTIDNRLLVVGERIIANEQTSTC